MQGYRKESQLRTEQRAKLSTDNVSRTICPQYSTDFHDTQGRLTVLGTVPDIG
jgi:hypothetical protein